MANTTFNGPVRSENGFKTIIKNSDTGAVTSDMTLSTYSTSITVAATGTDHKETSIGMPANFIPMGVAITVTGASANGVTINDIGTEDDDDGFVDGISAALNSTGFKGFFPCNGVLGMSGGETTAATATPDEVQLVVSGTAGAGGVVALKFFGISSDSPTT